MTVAIHSSSTYIPLYADIWGKVNQYLDPVDITILSTVSRIFRIISSYKAIWQEIGKNSFCFIGKTDDPQKTVYLIMKRTHQAGVKHFAFSHAEVHLFKRHKILLERIKAIAQDYIRRSQIDPDLFRLVLQAGARPGTDFHQVSILHAPFESCRLCLESGVKPTTLTLGAYLDGTLEQVRFIVEKGGKPNLEIIRRALMKNTKTKPVVLNYLVDQLGELDEFDIIMALDDEIPLNIVKKMVHHVKVASDAVIFMALARNVSLDVIRLLVSKIQNPFTLTCLQVGDDEKSIGLGFNGDIPLPPQRELNETFKSMFPSGEIKIKRWEVFTVEEPISLR